MKENLNNKAKFDIVLILASIILIGITGAFAYVIVKSNNNKSNLVNTLHVEKTENQKITGNYSFILDSKNKYVVTTDMKWITMENDGGSNTSIYYQLDCVNNFVTKIKERYQANLNTGNPTTNIEILYTKSIDESLEDEIKTLLNNIIAEGDVDESKDSHGFTIESIDGRKTTYSKEKIEKINDILREIDEL